MDEMPKLPAAELHTPDELLANATAMYTSGDSKLFRPAILEAITALEAFVQRTVFESLAGKLDPLLLKWLDEKTRMDFDTRLSILTPVATGLPIDKGGSLWRGYKSAKEIRNKVVHSGRKVTKEDTTMVIQVVRDWLSYLGSNVELEAALVDLKKWVEDQDALVINDPREAEILVDEFFRHTKAASAAHEVDVGAQRADLILDFGPRKVVVEAKLVRSGRNIINVRRAAIDQVDRIRREAHIHQACVVMFAKGLERTLFSQVERHDGGTIISVIIHIN
jgi:hypothetical protein